MQLSSACQEMLKAQSVLAETVRNVHKQLTVLPSPLFPYFEAFGWNQIRNSSFYQGCVHKPWYCGSQQLIYLRGTDKADGKRGA